MKKNLIRSFPTKESVVKIFRVMKLTMLFTILGILHAAADTYSQDARISLDLKDAELKEVITEIQKQTEFIFFYSPEDVKEVKNLDVNVRDAKLQEVLDDCFKNTDLEYEIKHKAIVLKKVPKTETSPSESKKPIEQQQKKTIKGKVTDENGESLPGVTVFIKGTTYGTITDVDGNYSLEIPDDAEVLVFSFVGMKSQEIAIVGQTQIDVILEEETVGLEEVVAIGYAFQKKANLTGAVSSVSGEIINKRPITQGSQALQGVVSGVFVNTNSGEPGNDDASIIIRGIGTLNNAEPLVLIDGIEGPLNSINTNDIASINILKDAASASIYGTRAANGVILITTKRGTVGKTTVNYNGSYGITSPTVLPKTVTDTRLYLETYVKASARTGRSHPFTPALIDEIAALPATDWVGDYVNTGSIQNHDVAISGGSDKFRYRWSTGYIGQDSYLKGDYYLNRINSRLNVDFSLSKKVNVGVSMAYVNSDNRQAPKGDASGGLGSGEINPYGGKGNFLYQILIVNPPNQFVKDEFGRYGGSGGESSRSQRHNPQGIIDNQWMDIDGNEFLGNAFVEFEPLKDLKIKYTSAINFQQESYQETRLEHEQYDRFGNRTAIREAGSQLRTQESTILNYTNWLQASWKKSINDHNFNLLAGVNQETSTIRRIGTYEKGFGSTSLVRIGNGTTSVDIGNFNGEWALQSIFGRINYNYKNKYLIEANIRRDGSSRFGENSRWATFPGVSAGYVISEEDFWNKDFIGYVKLRGSWGKLGVQSANLYPYASELTLGTDYNGNSGGALTKLGNPDLAWEETTTKDIGIDIKLFGGKVSLDADYFIKESTDILTDLENPLTSGIASKISVNAASIQNKGWDLSLNTSNNIGDLKITTGLNITHVKNKIIEINPALTNQDDKVWVNAANNVWWIRGEPINSMYGHKFDGIFQVEEFNSDGSLVNGMDYTWIGAVPRPGDIKYTDQNGDKIINEEDMVIMGNRNPEWLYGFNLNLEYKGWDLGALFQGVGKINGFIDRYTGNFGHSGLREYWLDGWTEENRSNTIPALFVDREGFSGKSIDGNGGLAHNSFWVVDQRYLRLKNIIVGYTVPSKLLEKYSISHLRLYVSGQNLWTISKLDDLDPERNQFTNHLGATLPQQKVVTFGLNLRF